jgi:hypothetical protein
MLAAFGPPVGAHADSLSVGPAPTPGAARVSRPGSESARICSSSLRLFRMSFEDDLSRVEEHVAEARRLVQRQKGLIIRLRAAGVNTWDAQRILWLLEANLRRFEEYRERLKTDAR